MPSGLLPQCQPSSTFWSWAHKARLPAERMALDFPQTLMRSASKPWRISSWGSKGHPPHSQVGRQSKRHLGFCKTKKCFHLCCSCKRNSPWLLRGRSGKRSPQDRNPLSSPGSLFFPLAHQDPHKGPSADPKGGRAQHSPHPPFWGHPPTTPGVHRAASSALSRLCRSQTERLPPRWDA